MRHIVMDKYVIDISEERHFDYRKSYPDDLDLDVTLKSIAIIDFQCVQMVADRAGLPIPQTMRMLEAHGASDKEVWLYSDIHDGKRVARSVEEWVREHDGRYDALYIAVCNKGGYRLPRSESILIYPSTVMEGRDIFYQSIGKRNSLRVEPAISG